MRQGAIALSAAFFAGIAALHAQGLRGQGVRIGHLDSGVSPVAAGITPQSIGGSYRVDPGGFGGAPAEPVDAWGHGTMTASVLMGTGTANLGAGIAPDAQLFTAAVLEEGNVLARLLVGLDWMIDQRPDVVLMPLGFAFSFRALRQMLDVLREADILIVAASGNGGAGAALWPACDIGVLSVGACDQQGLPIASSASRTWPPRQRIPCVPILLGPGKGIEVTAFRRSGRTTSGTSVASAVIAGLGALLRAAKPDAKAHHIHAALVNAAPVLPAGYNHRPVAGTPDPVEALCLLETRDELELSGFPDQRKASWKCDGPIIDVIFCFESLEVRKEAKLGVGDRGIIRATLLKHAPLAIVRLDCSHLEAWQAAPGLLDIEPADPFSVCHRTISLDIKGKHTAWHCRKKLA